MVEHMKNFSNIVKEIAFSSGACAVGIATTETLEGGPPSIVQVTPDIGVAGQVVTLTGANFAEGATVTFGEIKANVSAVSDTEITVIAPAGYEDVWVDISVRNPDGRSATRSKAFRYYSEGSTTPIIPNFTARVALTTGINTISLPLNPEIPYTASSLADVLKSTIVIQVDNGSFDAYVHAGSIGTDFPIQMGKGYIVNVMEAQNINITGKPWGEPVPAAPSRIVAEVAKLREFGIPSEPWAFVIAGKIEGTVPDSAGLRVTNLCTKESITVPISPSGEFTAAFVDMNRQSVVEAGDEIITQIIGAGDFPLTEVKRHVISHEHIVQAYLLTHLSARPEQSRLLQNYPNPFNPETWIPFKLAERADVTISIYNIKGNLIRTLKLGDKHAGIYVTKYRAAHWNGRNDAGERVSSGVYFYQINARDFVATKKLVILK